MTKKTKRYKVIYKTKKEPRFFGEYYVEAKNVDDAKNVFEDKYGDRFKAIKSILAKSDAELSMKEMKELIYICSKHKFILITYCKNATYSTATVREETTNKEKVLKYKKNAWIFD